MPAPRRKSLISSGPDRWLVLAGAGLLVLGLVLRLLTDIGRSTAQGDSAARIADTAATSVPVAPPTTADTLAATPAVVTPDPTPAPAPSAKPSRATKPRPAAPAAAPLATGGWGVQLGAFGRPENAERLRQQVEALGFRASVGGSGALTRVRVGSLGDRAAAQLAADSIARALGTRGLVVGPGR